MKKLICMVMAFCFALAAVGCSTNTSMAYTFSVETGDQVKVKLDTTGGYKLSSDMPFTVSLEGETLSQGQFIYGEYYDDYSAVAEEDADAVVLDSGEKDGNEYVFWCYDDSEYNFVVMIGDSDTALLLGNDVSEESARECFERLTITVED